MGKYPVLTHLAIRHLRGQMEPVGIPALRHAKILPATIVATRQIVYSSRMRLVNLPVPSAGGPEINVFIRRGAGMAVAPEVIVGF